VVPHRSPNLPDPDRSTPDAGRRARRRRVLSSWGPVVVWMAVIFALSSVPDLPAPPGGITDKAAHAWEYAPLGLLLVRALGGRRWTAPTARAVAGAILIAAGYGLVDEVHQLFVPGRQGDWYDAAADVLGASATAVALYCWGIIARLLGRLPDAS
jgi:VanZ family protein